MFFEDFSLSFEGYVDSSFSYVSFPVWDCDFLLMILIVMIVDDDDDDDDDDGNSDSLLFDDILLVIDSFLAFPRCFISNHAGADGWLHCIKKRKKNRLTKICEKDRKDHIFVSLCMFPFHGNIIFS